MWIALLITTLFAAIPAHAGELSAQSTGRDWERADETEKVVWATAAGRLAWPDASPIVAGYKMFSCLNSAMRARTRAEKEAVVMMRRTSLAQISAACGVLTPD
ncbi:MAG: hypothetical protein ACOYLQ_09670 [Hyphomicrobiaceae bacterium]